ncbi:Glycine--tRNA ligase, mitochondrial 1 [Porphyridium purpureum]|uniref:glycine--tRNA ligase n=1 Tax=Porphyridium purpureum TaxID=35688 RepID=A0A5J4ZAB2_PORPP|nr:Glycine--tRNA ligase, mitochondrial 1 [Porphyridium purpureum]|eukprot:POR0182..scf295_1
MGCVLGGAAAAVARRVWWWRGVYGGTAARELGGSGWAGVVSRSVVQSVRAMGHRGDAQDGAAATQRDAQLEQVEREIEALCERMLNEGDMVRQLRDSKACDHAELTAKEQALKQLNRDLNVLRVKQRELGGGVQAKSADAAAALFDRQRLDLTLKGRFFIANAFEIYGGVAGLYDYGPPGCAVKNHLTSLWREHFVVTDNMMELEASSLTPMPVLKASGHVDRFADLLVKDSVTHDCFRADHLLKEHLDALIANKPHPYVIAERKKQAKAAKAKDKASDAPPPQDVDGWIDLESNPELKEKAINLRERLDEVGLDEMKQCIEEWQVRAVETGNKVTEPYEFNLMFATAIGPAGIVPGFLRPETAQGIFVNFKRLLDYNGGKLPFAVAQIGSSFRNEIRPQQGLLRVREFTQAEIEYFVNPQQKLHPRFDEVAELCVTMYPRRNQLTTHSCVSMTVADAVKGGVIANEALGYFIGRTWQFVERAGFNLEHVRFRQHLEHEMAHYAKDCWDLEVNSSYGWIECAGLADRDAFDLRNHTEASGQELNAREVYDTVRYETQFRAVPDKSKLGKALKREAAAVIQTLDAMRGDDAKELQSALQNGAKVAVAGHDIDASMVNFEEEKVTISGHNYYPGVIEPSFGIGRLLYCLFEHVFYVRPGDDEARAVLALRPALAPIKVAILPISNKPAFAPILRRLVDAFRAKRVLCKLDESGVSIGKRYSRSDELGTPFGITVDFESEADDSVTLRERDSTKQVRASIPVIVDAVARLSSGEWTWQSIVEQPDVFRPFTAAQE